MTVIANDHGVAVEVAVHHGRAFGRDGDPRHLDIIEELNQSVASPALWLTDTISRLGRHNAMNAGFEAPLVETCLRLRRER